MFNKFSHGYTLLELVVVLVLIGLVLGFGLPAFSSYGANSALHNKADEMSEFVNQAYLLSQTPANIDDKSYNLTIHSDGALELSKTSISGNVTAKYRTVEVGSGNSVLNSKSAGSEKYIIFPADKSLGISKNFTDGSAFFQIANGSKTYNIMVQNSPVFKVWVKEVAS